MGSMLITIPQCRPAWTPTRTNPQYADSICRIRAKRIPPLTGRKRNTSLERITPLTISPSMQASRRKLTAVCKIRAAGQRPFPKPLYQRQFKA